VFRKVESERILTRKIWDHTIDLKKTFVPQKKRIYLLSKDEREEVQNFIEDQLRKGYIRILSNITSIFCRQEEWKEEDSYELLQLE